MIVASPLLFDLARGVELGITDPSERSLVVPPVLSPVVEIPYAQPRIVTLATTVQRGSFAADNTLSKAASQAASSATVCTLGAGLWRLAITATFMASFTETLGAFGADNALHFRDPEGAFIRVFKFFAAANVPQRDHVVLQVLLPRENFLVEIRAGATGVGQQLDLWGVVLGTRLA